MTENRPYSNKEIYDAIQASSLDASVKALTEEQVKYITQWMQGKEFSGVVISKLETQTISYTVSSEAQAFAGANQQIPSGTSTAQLAGNTPTVDKQTGCWSLFSKAGFEWNGTFDDASKPDAVFTSNVTGKFILVWSLLGTESNILSSSQVEIEFLNE